MTKYFCDRCGKEVEKLFAIMLFSDWQAWHDGAQPVFVHTVCRYCADEIKKMIDTQ